MLRSTLALLSVLALLGGLAAAGSAPPARASTACRASYADGERIRITVLRGTTCRRANEVAAVYLEGSRYPAGAWRCAPAHGDPKVAFSCGAGRRGSDLRNWRHAFTAQRVGA